MLTKISTTAVSRRIRSRSGTSSWVCHSCSSAGCTRSSEGSRAGTDTRMSSAAADSGIERLRHALPRLQHLVDVRHLQDHPDRLAGACDPQVAACLTSRLETRDESPEPGRVQEGGL